MTKKKIIFTVLLVLSMVVCSMPAFAFDTTTQLINQLREGIPVGDKNVYMPEDFVAELENWSDKEELTTKQVNDVYSYVESAAKYTVENNVTPANATSKDSQKLLNYFKGAIESVGASVEIDTEDTTVTVYDKNGKMVTSGVGLAGITVADAKDGKVSNVSANSNAVKKTGYDLKTTFIIAGIVLIALVGSAIVALSKKNGEASI